MATAITPMAFFETVMVKGYETLVDSGTKVDVNTGMIAAGRLQALIESRASGTRIADLRVQMGRIINAIHSSVPEELWPEILRKIDGPVAADTPGDEIEDWRRGRGVRPRGIVSGRGALLDCVRGERLKRHSVGSVRRVYRSHVLQSTCTVARPRPRSSSAANGVGASAGFRERNRSSKASRSSMCRSLLVAMGRSASGAGI